MADPTHDTPYSPAWTVPPGQMIVDALDARRWDEADLAMAMAAPVEMVEALIDGVAEITPAIAERLASALGREARYWLEIQSVYDRRRAGRR